MHVTRVHRRSQGGGGALDACVTLPRAEKKWGGANLEGKVVNTPQPGRACTPQAVQESNFLGKKVVNFSGGRKVHSQIKSWLRLCTRCMQEARKQAGSGVVSEVGVTRCGNWWWRPTFFPWKSYNHFSHRRPLPSPLRLPTDRLCSVLCKYSRKNVGFH